MIDKVMELQAENKTLASALHDARQEVRVIKNKAERVKEMKKLIEKADEHAVRNGKEIMKLTDERNRIDFQNKRYRELLNKVAYEDIDFQQTVNIVRKELEAKE